MGPRSEATQERQKQTGSRGPLDLGFSELHQRTTGHQGEGDGGICMTGNAELARICNCRNTVMLAEQSGSRRQVSSVLT